MKYDERELLTAALNMWWLRPENGLAIASYCLRGFDFTPPLEGRSADYACGDGVNTFFKLGGRFDSNFDLFGDSVRSENAKDVVEKKIDIFDHFDQSYSPSILSRPKTRFTYGTDHKNNLLLKAGKLDFYDNLLHSDLLEDTSIQDGSLDVAYCNSLYWVESVETAVSNIYRKLKSDGIAVFDVMTSHRQEVQFQNLLPSLPSSWHNLMNRGRDANNPGIRTAEEWRQIFEANSVSVVEEERDIFPSTVAHAWNIGLRPLFPVLNRMVQSMTPENKQSIKDEWVETWTELLLPMLIMPNEFPNDGRQVRLQYIIRKL